MEVFPVKFEEFDFTVHNVPKKKVLSRQCFWAHKDDEKKRVATCQTSEGPKKYICSLDENNDWIAISPA
jgi:hypothetical protein